MFLSILRIGFAFLLAVFLSCGWAEAAFNCSVQFQNGFGDTLGGGYDVYSSDPNNGNILNEWQVDWHDPNGALAFNPPGGQPNSPHLHWDFTLTAPSSNTTVSVTQVSGPDIGNCSMYVEYVVPRSLFSVITDPDKQTAGNIATAIAAFSGTTTGAGLVFSASDPPLGAVLIGAGYGAGLFWTHFDRIAHDPWDGDFCSETSFSVDPQVDSDLSWVCPTVGDDGLSEICPLLIQSIEVIDGLGSQAGQATDRAMSADMAGVSDCAWDRRYEAISALNAMGDWIWDYRYAVQRTGDFMSARGQDPSSLYGSLDGLGQIASWLQGLPK